MGHQRRPGTSPLHWNHDIFFIGKQILGLLNEVSEISLLFTSIDIKQLM
jgi:hypothetical protein